MQTYGIPVCVYGPVVCSHPRTPTPFLAATPTPAPTLHSLPRGHVPHCQRATALENQHRTHQKAIQAALASASADKNDAVRQAVETQQRQAVAAAEEVRIAGEARVAAAEANTLQAETRAAAAIAAVAAAGKVSALRV